MNKDINKQIKRIVSEFQNKYGNDLTINSNGIMTKQEEINYNQKYNRNDTFRFDIHDVMSAIHVIPFLYTPHERKTSNSYVMKHKVERNPQYIKLKGHRYLSNGNLIIAMLIMGYKYRYDRGNYTTPSPNIDFFVASTERYVRKKNIGKYDNVVCY